MLIAHHVWGTPPGGSGPVLLGTYDADRYQWALKLARRARDVGYERVEIRDEEAFQELPGGPAEAVRGG